MTKRNAKKGGRGSTPVTFKSQNMPASQMHSFMEEWSLVQAESNHVETIEEANDFNLNDDDDDFFTKIPNLTVYEMHDQAEENLELYNNSLPEEAENDQETEDESNETDDRAQDTTKTPAQPSAPVHEPASEPST